MDEFALHRRRRNPRLLSWLVAAIVLTTLAHAQRERFEVEGVSLAFDRPTAWHLIEAPTATAPFTITMADGEGAAIAINVILLEPETAREIEELGGVANALQAWDGFSGEIAGARVVSVDEIGLADRLAGRLRYASPDVGGSAIVFVADGTLVTIVTTAPLGRGAALDAAADTVLAQLEVRGHLAAARENPLLRAGSRTPGAQNPLHRNQAAAASEPVFVEPFTSRDAATVFGGTLDLGPSGAWTGALTGTAYELRNVADPTAVRFYSIDLIEGFTAPPSAARVSVDVTVEPGGDLAAAGLLFDYDAEHGTYLAFGVSTGGVTVLQRSDAGLELLVEQPSDAVMPGAVNRLELRPSGTDLEIFVNDRFVMTLQATNAFVGGVGIIAIGSGAFTFRDLVIDARE